MKTELWPLERLIDYARNPRKNDHAVDRVAAAIKEFGFRVPIVAKSDGLVVDGHLRLKAARKLGLAEVPVVLADDLTDAQVKAFRISVNRMAELAEWDSELLALELGELGELGFDLDLTGFGEGEIAALTPEVLPEGKTDPDEVPEVPPTPRSVLGDVWLLGKHRVMCGDSTKAEDVGRLMAGKKADLCFTSPPYGQQRDYTAEGKEKVQDWDALMKGVFSVLPVSDSAQLLVNLGLIHRDGEWIPYWDGWIECMSQLGWRRFGWYVWDQGPGMPGDWNGRLAPSHEFIWHFNKQSMRAQKARECKHAGEAHTGKGQRGKDGVVKERSAGNAPVQSHAIHDSVFRVNRQGAMHGADGHPAPYPVGLPLIALQSWCGDVYEPFCGSGTTLIAAEQIGRRCYGMEISPAYCDVIVKRWQEFTGKQATRESDGKLFDEVT